MLSDSPGADDKALGDVLRRLWGDGKNTMGLNQDGDGLPDQGSLDKPKPGINSIAASDLSVLLSSS